MKADLILQEAECYYRAGSCFPVQPRVDALNAFMKEHGDDVKIVFNRYHEHPNERHKYIAWAKIGQMRNPQKFIWAVKEKES